MKCDSYSLSLPIPRTEYSSPLFFFDTPRAFHDFQGFLVSDFRFLSFSSHVSQLVMCDNPPPPDEQ